MRTDFSSTDPSFQTTSHATPTRPRNKARPCRRIWVGPVVPAHYTDRHDPLRRYTGRQVWNRQTAMSSWTELPGPRARFMITIGAQKEALTCTLSKQPIGIEPMTYALRGGFRPSTTVQWVTPALLARLLVPPTSKVMQSCCWQIR